jgi:SAM-dependent methyltransferase
MDDPGELTPAQRDRWDRVLGLLAVLIADGRAGVVVDGYQDTDLFAQRLGEAAGLAVAHGYEARARPPDGGWDLVVWLRTAPLEVARQTDRDQADVVVDLHDTSWPVVRYVRPEWMDKESWYLPEIQAFFAARADRWDQRFGDDLPAYAAAVGSAQIRPGAVVADIGCGTGRALPPLRAAAGPAGVVIGLDVTPEMLLAASGHAKDADATLVVADARRLPLPDGALDVAFTAGLITHLPDMVAGLAELARVTRSGGRLVLFHPSGRTALAARHGRRVMPGEPLDEGPLRRSLDRSGWTLDLYDDQPDRFLALATRR